MTTTSDRDKSLRLLSLEQWARSHYQKETWTTPEFKKALEEYCLLTWAESDGKARNMAKIVQLRMTRAKPAPLVSRQEPVHGADPPEGSVLDIITGYRQANPEEFRAPRTDFHVVEEE